MRIALALVALLACSAASAEAATPPAFAGAGTAQVRQELNGLFASLATAGSPEAAKPIKAQILAVFLQSGSPSVDLLMSRAADALTGGDVATAKKLLDAVTAIAPDYAEGWHQRGRLEALAGNDEAAMISLERAVMLNPRQFQALAELGSMLEDYGDKSGALTMYRKAMALDPTLDGVARHLRELKRAVEGERI